MHAFLTFEEIIIVELFQFSFSLMCDYEFLQSNYLINYDFIQIMNLPY